MSLQVYPLPSVSAERMFERLRERPWAMWLDSGAGGTFGLYDVLVAAPRATLTSHGGNLHLIEAGRERQWRGDPFDYIESRLRRTPREPLPGVPFTGGAVGYLGYDLGARLQGVVDPRAAADMPELAVGFYDWAVICDRRRGTCFWVGTAQDRREAEALAASLSETPTPAATFEPLPDTLDRPAWEDYRAAFAQVQGHLQAGDCYQINLARPFRARYRGDPWQAYRRLRDISPAPFGAYLRLPFGHVLSNSPERFLTVRDGAVETRPIKGTRPRRADVDADRAEAEALQRSEKDRAENVMIVDLLRNDLGKCCAIGSVRVTELCALESYAVVHHLVSAVRGELAPAQSAASLLHHCLPGGSITGAPKHRAMQIIQALEPEPRGVYCGAIGYLGYDGDMDMNIGIRTLVCRDGMATYWAGGGVVIDSDAAREFDEIHDKAAAFLRLMQA